ncbi:MAG: hypothetical protein QOF73_3441 [Thermomicrobiales bacterium]|nr:hypothetical protein [Thermomicrobiales bacterium]
MSESAADDGRRPFRGFRSPAYTQVPDELFDELLPDLSGAELKTLLYVIRRTFGFKRESDSISLAQMLHGLHASDGRRLDRGVGISKPTLLQALRSLEDRQVIVTERRRSAEKGNEPTVYRLRFAEDAIPDGAPPPAPDPLVKKFDQGVVKKFDQGLVNKFDQGVVKKFDQGLVNKFDQDRQTVKDIQTEKEFEIRKKKTAGNWETAPVADPADNSPVATGHIPETPVAAVAVGSPRGRPPGTVAEREQLHGYLADFARELHDGAPLPATITRVVNLFRRADVPSAEWSGYLYRARAITQERTAQIRSAGTGTGPGGWSPKNKIPYFLAVLEDLLGLRTPATGEAAGAGASPPADTSWPSRHRLAGPDTVGRSGRPAAEPVRGTPGSPRRGDRTRS